MDNFSSCIRDSLDNKWKHINIKIVLYFSYHYYYGPTKVTYLEEVFLLSK